MRFHSNDSLWRRRRFSCNAKKSLLLTLPGEVLCFVNGIEITGWKISWSILKKGSNQRSLRLAAPTGRREINAIPILENSPSMKLSGPGEMQVEQNLTKIREFNPEQSSGNRFHDMMQTFMPYMSYFGGEPMVRLARGIYKRNIPSADPPKGWIEEDAIRPFSDSARSLPGTGDFYTAGNHRPFFPSEITRERNGLVHRSAIVPRSNDTRSGRADNPAGNDFCKEEGFLNVPFWTDCFKIGGENTHD